MIRLAKSLFDRPVNARVEYVVAHLRSPSGIESANGDYLRRILEAQIKLAGWKEGGVEDYDGISYRWAYKELKEKYNEQPG